MPNIIPRTADDVAVSSSATASNSVCGSISMDMLPPLDTAYTAISLLFRREWLRYLLRHAMHDAFGIGSAQIEDDMGRARGDIWADRVAAGGQIVRRDQHLNRTLNAQRVAAYLLAVAIQQRALVR